MGPGAHHAGYGVPGNCPACYLLMPSLVFICRKPVIVAQVGRGVFLMFCAGVRKKKVENP